MSALGSRSQNESDERRTSRLVKPLRQRCGRARPLSAAGFKHQGGRKGRRENRKKQGEVPNVGAGTGSATSDVLRLTEALS